MELEETIKDLKDKIWLIKSGNISGKENFEKLGDEIDTVLDELNNRNKRIHKLEKNIEFIINKIVNKAKEYRYHTEITAGTNIETKIRKQTLTELLEEIEKEI